MAILSPFCGAWSRAFALGALLSVTLFTVGCTDPQTPPAPVATASVWTFSEGQYQQTNANIIPYDPINKVASPSDLFSAANDGKTLGDIPTSATAYNGQLFVPISGSGKIYILDPTSGRLTNKITELNSPRYVYIVNETKGYISNLYKAELTIFNPTTLAITGSIALASAGEQFVTTAEGLFINLWSGGKQVAKIDPATDQVVSSIKVGIQPASMAADNQNNLWLACDGGGWESNPVGFEKPSLVKLNPQATQVLQQWELPAGSFSFRVAATDGGASILVLCGHIYKLSTNATAFPTTPFIQLPEGVKSSYSLGVDPGNGDIYVGDAADFQQRGTVYRYDKEGKLVDQYKAGVGPAFYYFQPIQ